MCGRYGVDRLPAPLSATPISIRGGPAVPQALESATDTTADSSIATSEGTALLKGGAECGDAYLTLAGTTIVVEAAGSVGDWLEMVCDGTYWYVSGHGAHDASFSVS